MNKKEPSLNIHSEMNNKEPSPNIQIFTKGAYFFILKNVILVMYVKKMYER